MTSGHHEDTKNSFIVAGIQVDETIHASNRNFSLPAASRQEFPMQLNRVVLNAPCGVSPYTNSCRTAQTAA